MKRTLGDTFSPELLAKLKHREANPTEQDLLARKHMQELVDGLNEGVRQSMAHKPLVPGRTPEQQAKIDEFNEKIGQELVGSLNRGATKGD